MGATHNPDIKSGIKINGVDAFDIDPEIVKDIINSDETGLVRAIFEEKRDSIYEEMTGMPLPNDYASHVGRPSLKEVPYGMSENDGYPFLKGHDPLCSGKPYHKGMCKCKYDKWNMRNGISESEMWPGGPSLDDFDM